MRTPAAWRKLSARLRAWVQLSLGAFDPRRFLGNWLNHFESWSLKFRFFVYRHPYESNAYKTLIYRWVFDPCRLHRKYTQPLRIMKFPSVPIDMLANIYIVRAVSFYFPVVVVVHILAQEMCEVWCPRCCNCRRHEHVESTSAEQEATGTRTKQAVLRIFGCLL